MRSIHGLPFAAITILALFALGACSGSADDTHPDQPVTKRRAVFKQFTRTLEPMGMVARDRKKYNQQEFNASALELQKLANQPWVYFTPDSNYPPTRANPKVWSKPLEFRQAQEDYQTSVRQLVESARVGNLDVIRAAVNDVQRSCKTCHDQFRNAS
jgi:cytochrome c556